MKKHSKKILAGAMLPVIALAAVATVLFVISQPTSTEAAESQTIPSRGGPLSAKQMFEKGYATNLVVAKIEQGEVQVKRGETVNIPVTIQHLSNSQDSSAVVLTNFHNMFRNFAPSANAGLTDEEFSERILNNPMIDGEVRMDDRVKVTPSAVTLEPNSIKTVNMFVTVPKDLPSEMTNKSITIGLGYDVEPRTSQIRTVTPSISIVVVE